MPRKSRSRIAMEKYIDEVKKRIIEDRIVDASGVFDPIPPRHRVREELEKPPIGILERL